MLNELSVNWILGPSIMYFSGSSKINMAIRHLHLRAPITKINDVNIFAIDYLYWLHLYRLPPPNNEYRHLWEEGAY